jgi:hypothetical protein
MKSLLFIVISFFSTFCFPQKCEVFVDPLKGSYQGDCKKNKADGNGTANGEDVYSGEFKNGYPDGKGKYVWKNGDWYEGEWKKGLREGQGIMHLVERDAKDSVLDGFWKNDKYIGKYENAYTIHYKSADLVHISVKKEKTIIHNITITLESIRGGAMGIRAQIPKPTITNLDVINGLFISQLDQTNMPKTNSTTLRDVKFPFRARVTIGTELLDIEFFEEGKYLVDIRINQ